MQKRKLEDFDFFQMASRYKRMLKLRIDHYAHFEHNFQAFYLRLSCINNLPWQGYHLVGQKKNFDVTIEPHQHMTNWHIPHGFSVRKLFMGHVLLDFDDSSS